MLEVDIVGTGRLLGKYRNKISEKIDVTDRTIENDLAQLKKMGILTREGGRKEGRWVVNDIPE